MPGAGRAAAASGGQSVFEKIAAVHQLSSVRLRVPFVHMLTERLGKQPRQDGAVGDRRSSRHDTEVDRQLPAGRRNLSRSRRPFRPRPGGREPRRWRARASRRRRCRCRPIPTARRPAPATSPRCSARGYIEVLFKTADTPLGREFEAALAGHAGVHLAAFSIADAEGAAPAPDRRGLRHAAAGAVPASGRHRDRAGRRRLHGGAARARRDGGRAASRCWRTAPRTRCGRSAG